MQNYFVKQCTVLLAKRSLKANLIQNANARNDDIVNLHVKVIFNSNIKYKRTSCDIVYEKLLIVDPAKA